MPEILEIKRPLGSVSIHIEIELEDDTGWSRTDSVSHAQANLPVKDLVYVVASQLRELADKFDPWKHEHVSQELSQLIGR